MSSLDETALAVAKEAALEAGSVLRALSEETGLSRRDAPCSVFG